LGNREFNPPEHCQFQNPDRGNPDRRKGDLEEFPVGEKFPDREIGELQKFFRPRKEKGLVSGRAIWVVHPAITRGK
jgi:hypothetical protein